MNPETRTRAQTPVIYIRRGGHACVSETVSSISSFVCSPARVEYFILAAALGAKQKVDASVGLISDKGGVYSK